MIGTDGKTYPDLTDDQRSLLVAMSKRGSASQVAGLGWTTPRRLAVLAELEALGMVVNAGVN